MKHTPLSTSLRSAIQTTDSSRSGCTANTAAAIALGQTSRVIIRNARKRRTAATAWRKMLVA
ncbi:MAG: hypothetical protein EXS35_09160 [Pedosphaera sp.]|nr:hypothetical protein [Pedosphaera sp.]